MINLLLRLILRLFYGYRAHGTEVLDTRGPVLLIPNHVSWIDWLLVGAVLEGDWKFVVSSTVAEKSFLHRWIMTGRRCFPVDTRSPYAVRTMAEFLSTGGRLVLFAEGRLSTTGSLMKLQDGSGFLISRTGAKVITCHLHGAERCPFVKHEGWTRWFPRISVHFGKVLTAPTLDEVPHHQHRALLTEWLRDRMVEQQYEVSRRLSPPRVEQALVAMAKNHPAKKALEDYRLEPLSYRRVLVGSRLLGGRLDALLRGERRVGILLPNTNATVLGLVGLWACGRTPAMLNYSSGFATILGCCQLAGLRSIVTSAAFLEKVRLNAEHFESAGIRVVLLEDLAKAIGALEKLGTLLEQTLVPGRGLTSAGSDSEETALVLFTSGSEGVPKGVELSHANLLSNVAQALAVIDLEDSDSFFNALPLFHSFGLTAGTLLPLLRGCPVFLHVSPLQYRLIPQIIYDRRCTVMLGTNTFLNGYARKAHAYDFNSVRYLIAGAEKVQQPTFDTWARRFGIRILEGYGATECSPVISVNTRVDPEVGTAGKLLPCIEYRLDPVEGVPEGGRLQVRGPNVMKGYLNVEAQATFAAAQGWYDTGDIVTVDRSRRVRIQGRLKRFAKISGEMISLTAVEETLAAAFPEFGPRFDSAVVAIPDADKGEKLVAFCNEPKLDLGQLRKRLREQGLPNLASPRALVYLPKLPKLGTGKPDHRALATQALELA